MSNTTTVSNPVDAEVILAAHGVLDAAAAGTLLVVGLIDVSAGIPDEIILKVSLYAGTSTSGNQQVSIYAQTGMDSTGGTPDVDTSATSGTTLTNLLNAKLLGTLSIPAANTLHTTHLPIYNTIGFKPAYMNLIILPDYGAALGTNSSQQITYYAQRTVLTTV